MKGTSIEHKMLGGSEDEMYPSDDDVVDVTDMLGDDKEEVTVCFSIDTAYIEVCVAVPNNKPKNKQQKRSV